MLTEELKEARRILKTAITEIKCVKHRNYPELLNKGMIEKVAQIDQQLAIANIQLKQITEVLEA